MEEKIYETVKSEMEEIEKNGSFDLGKIPNIVSGLNELDPDVAKNLVAQYPVFAGVLKEAVVQYANMINTIVSGNDKSMEKFYKILEMECGGTDNARKYLFELSYKAMEIYKSITSNPNAPESLVLEAASKQLEVLKIFAEFEKMEQEKDKDIRDGAARKETENKNWLMETLKFGGTAVLSIACTAGTFLLFQKLKK